MPDFTAPDSSWPSLDPPEPRRTTDPGTGDPGQSSRQEPWGPADTGQQGRPTGSQQPWGQPVPDSSGSHGPAGPAWSAPIGLGRGPLQQPGASPYASGVPASWSPGTNRSAPGRGPAQKDTGRPVVTYTMMAICAAVWLLGTLVPSLQRLIELTPVLVFDEPWRLLTGGFLYLSGDFLTIGIGLLTIWITGQALEPVMGRVNFLMTYFLSLLGGASAFVLWSWQLGGHGLAYGASGAIWGMFGALVTLQGKGQRGVSGGLWALIGLNLGYAVLFPSFAWQVKVGGFLIGLAAGWIIRRSRRAGHTRARALWCLLVPSIVALALARML